MATTRRNPYVVLGVPFGATAEEARTGFARASRRVRAASSHAYSMEDLTWALHQVERIIDDPSIAFDVYRVPANPQATSVARPGVFTPLPEQIGRTSEPTTPKAWATVRGRAARELLRDALTAASLDLHIPRPYGTEEFTNGAE